MKQDKMKSTPVDPNKPENPVELLVRSVNYLNGQIARLAALAHDGANCETAATQTVIMAEMDRMLSFYRDRGLQALNHITNDVVAQHNAQVDRLNAAAKAKEAKDGMEQEDAHAGVGEGDVRREDQGVAPVGTVEAEGQGDADRGGAEAPKAG